MALPPCSPAGTQVTQRRNLAKQMASRIMIMKKLEGRAAKKPLEVPASDSELEVSECIQL